MSTESSKEYILETWHVKQLLLVLERENLPLHQIIIRSVCDRNQEVFGVLCTKTTHDQKESKIHHAKGKATSLFILIGLSLLSWTR
eukprot:13745564-Ditylum_brightwellii.AAC.1